MNPINKMLTASGLRAGDGPDLVSWLQAANLVTYCRSFFLLVEGIVI